jgi:hypothetical protein
MTKQSKILVGLGSVGLIALLYVYFKKPRIPQVANIQPPIPTPNTNIGRPIREFIVTKNYFIKTGVFFNQGQAIKGYVDYQNCNGGEKCPIITTLNGKAPQFIEGEVTYSIPNGYLKS